MGHKQNKAFNKRKIKHRFLTRKNNGDILATALKYINRWKKIKELVSSLEEDAEISKKKLLQLLASFEED